MNYLILALATWRITNLFTTEDGPFGVFTRLRHLVGVRYDDYSQPYGDNELARGVICTYCVSVWVGVAITIAYLLYAKLTVVLSLPFALSATAIGFDELIIND